jgi:hypothetical protein
VAFETSQLEIISLNEEQLKNIDSNVVVFVTSQELILLIVVIEVHPLNIKVKLTEPDKLGVSTTVVNVKLLHP